MLRPSNLSVTMTHLRDIKSWACVTIKSTIKSLCFDLASRHSCAVQHCESEESQIMKDKWRRVQNRVESWECVIINHHGWQHYHDQVWLHESPLDRPRLWPGPVLLKLGLRHQQHHLLHQPVHQLCHPVIAGAEKDCKLDNPSRESLIKLSEGERVHGGHRNKRHDLLNPLYKHPNLAARGHW